MPQPALRKELLALKAEDLQTRAQLEERRVLGSPEPWKSLFASS